MGNNDSPLPLKDNDFLVRAIGHELSLVGSIALCSVVNGHSAALARWWGIGVIPRIWNKYISGDQGGAVMNTVTGMLSLYLGWASKDNSSAKGPKIMFIILGPITLLVAGLLLTNNDSPLPLKDNDFLVRAIGHELSLVGSLALCSVVNGHSAALARWWAVGVIPSIWNKYISGDQGGAVMNAAVAVLSLYLGWASKTA